jgi:hypothetical protein
MSARMLDALFCVALVWPVPQTTTFGFSVSRPTLDQSETQAPRDCYHCSTDFRYFGSRHQALSFISIGGR